MIATQLRSFFPFSLIVTVCNACIANYQSHRSKVIPPRRHSFNIILLFNMSMIWRQVKKNMKHIIHIACKHASIASTSRKRAQKKKKIFNSICRSKVFIKHKVCFFCFAHVDLCGKNKVSYSHVPTYIVIFFNQSWCPEISTATSGVYAG